MKRLSQAILRTLAYADVFDYPLKPEEIWRFLLSGSQSGSRSQSSGSQSGSRSQSSASSFQRLITRPPAGIFSHQGFYFLKGRKKTVSLRKKKERWSQEKQKKAGRAASWLKLIPWIKMVAISGALAMNNADQKDDIDFLIVTQKNRLWLTRFLTVFLIELTGQRRRPEDKKVKDKICLNMFLDETHLKVPQKERDLFSAHEVCQLKPIWERNRTYQQFIKSNLWVKKYLPNWKL